MTNKVIFPWKGVPLRSWKRSWKSTLYINGTDGCGKCEEEQLCGQEFEISSAK